jgi:hypothetical protein
VLRKLQRRAAAEKENKGWSRTKKFELVRQCERGNPSPASRAQGKGESSNG